MVAHKFDIEKCSEQQRLYPDHQRPKWIEQAGKKKKKDTM